MSSRLAPFTVVGWLVFSCGGDVVGSGNGTGTGVGGSGNATGVGGSGNATGVGGSGNATGLSDCTWSSECIVVPASCCGTCGAATRGDSFGLNVDHADEYNARPCFGRGCPACYRAPDPTLVATCAGGMCAVVDLQQHPSTSCISDSDCRIRVQGCCECGGSTSPGTLIAVSDPDLYMSLVCDYPSCPECVPAYPPEVIPRCTSGHCTAEDPRFP